MTAWDAVDVDGLVALLTEDALMTMPPERMRVAGASAIGDFFASVPQGGRLDEIRLVPTSANRQPTAASYLREHGGTEWRAFKLDVLRIEAGRVAEITTFNADLFPTFGLPPTLPD